MSLRIGFRLLVVILTCVLSLSAAAGDVRAIWIWEEETFRLLDEPGWRDEVLGRLSEDGFNTLYLYADEWKGRTPIADEPGKYATLIGEAHERGYRVEALLGSAYLQTNRYVLPDMRDAARAMIERVLDYNRGRSPRETFDAIQLDIEPYTLNEWKADRQAVVEHFVDASREWRMLAKDGEQSIEIGAAIPFWFDRVQWRDDSLAVALLESFDYVALMDYRDRAEGRDGIVEHARFEVATAEHLGRGVIVGVETDEADLDKLTFAEEGRGYMDAELAKVRAELGASGGFRGTAVHHLRSYLKMK